MRLIKAILVPVIVAALAASVWPPGQHQSRSQPENRIPALARLVAEQEEESARAVAEYRPKSRARVDDLSLPVGDLLRQLPGVVEVELCVPAANPTHRIVHLCDWHFVPKDLYAIEAEGMTAGEFERLHHELLLEVEAVQAEQLALLRCLIRHHGLKRLFCEGLTAEGLPNYREKIAVLRLMEETQISGLRQQLADVRQLLQRTESQTDRYAKAKAIEAEITGMLDEHKHRLLEIGAPGRLLVAGEIDEVLPLDDLELLDRAKPVTPRGKVRFDPERRQARQDAQVKAVLEKGGGLIVLGAAHDLSGSVRKRVDARCQYLRVTTRRVREFSE